MPNTFAYIMLLGWPFLAFFITKKKPVDKATILLFILPFLILPTGLFIDLPGIPPLDKTTIPALIAFYILYFKYKNFKLLPESGIGKILIIALFIIPFFTYFNNRDALHYGVKTLPALKFMADIPNMIFGNVTTYYIPFMAAYNYLNTKDAHKNLLIFIVIAGLIYSLPTLWEIRMSPQLHKDFYGYFPHSWRQQLRQGGFRPVVFLGHGLYIAVFFSQVFIAACIIWKEKIQPLSKNGLAIILFFSIVLLLSKSWSALIYVSIALLIITMSNAKKWSQAALTISIIVMLFPMLRSTDIVPTEGITDFISQYNPARGGSLKFRFDNEDILLEKANQRPAFGWGGWGRGRVFDPESGRDISTTDGTWVLIFGGNGWAGYIAIFGLLVFPIIKHSSHIKKQISAQQNRITIGLCLMLSFNLLDLIPNSSLTPLTFILAGSILGYVHREQKALSPKPLIDDL